MANDMPHVIFNFLVVVQNFETLWLPLLSRPFHSSDILEWQPLVKSDLVRYICFIFYWFFNETSEAVSHVRKSIRLKMNQSLWKILTKIEGSKVENYLNWYGMILERYVYIRFLKGLLANPLKGLLRDIVFAHFVGIDLLSKIFNRSRTIRSIYNKSS